MATTNKNYLVEVHNGLSSSLEKKDGVNFATEVR